MQLIQQNYNGGAVEQATEEYKEVELKEIDKISLGNDSAVIYVQSCLCFCSNSCMPIKLKLWVTNASACQMKTFCTIFKVVGKQFVIHYWTIWLVTAQYT